LKYVFDLIIAGTFFIGGLYNLKKAGKEKGEGKDQGFLKISGWWMLILALTVTFFKLVLPLFVSMGVLK
jgi:hypothetical protein